MQARPRIDSGNLASGALLKSTCMHQQGGCAWPVSRSTSIAQRFDSPHSGQRVASMTAGRRDRHASTKAGSFLATATFCSVTYTGRPSR
jgi:hypothetical protein